MASELTAAKLAELKAAWEKWCADDEVTDIDVNTNLWRLLVCNVPALIAAAERAEAAEKRVRELEEALERIDNGRNATQVRTNEIERSHMPDHLVTPDGFIDMPPATKRGIMWAADIARTALGKEPRT